MSKIRIYQAGGRVYIEGGALGERIDMMFYVAGMEHGYVYTREHKQVCEGLASTGSTLFCSRANLLPLIRKEWRKHRRSLPIN